MKIFTRFLPEAKYKTLIESLPKFKDKPLTIFNDYLPTQEELWINPINILILNEPNEFFGHHTYAWQHQSDFSVILTWNQTLLDNLPNAILSHSAEKKLDDNYIQSFAHNTERVFEVTFLRGILDLVEGHKLRHKLFALENEITLTHTFWPVLDDFNWETKARPGDDENGNSIWGEGKKQIWDRNSMFHVVIENTKHQNFYTEKIQDCFYTKTVPIYWGCPNIGEFWDDRGIINFNTEEEAVEIINKLTPEDYYSRLPYIQNNYEIALEQGCFYKRLELFLDELITLNKL